METRVNVIGYRISSTKRPRRSFDFKALIKVRGLHLFEARHLLEKKMVSLEISYFFFQNMFSIINQPNL